MIDKTLIDKKLLFRIEQLLDELRGNVNPERDCAEELEAEILITRDQLRAALDAQQQETVAWMPILGTSLALRMDFCNERLGGGMEKRRPTGFVATCQCGVVVGAMDYTRTDRKDAGQMLGRWLSAGCTVEPRFEGTWKVTVEACRCERNRSR